MGSNGYPNSQKYALGYLLSSRTGLALKLKLTLNTRPPSLSLPVLGSQVSAAHPAFRVCVNGNPKKGRSER